MKKQVLSMISRVTILMMVMFFGLANSAEASSKDMQSILDRLEITNQMGLYTFAWDEGRPEEFRAIFTEDAVFETWTPRKKAILSKTVSLQELIDRRKSLGGEGASDMAIRHSLSKVTFLELTETTAKTKTIYTFSMFIETALNEPTLIVSGSFNDRWVKTDKGWRIKDRVIIYDNMPPILTEMMQQQSE